MLFRRPSRAPRFRRRAAQRPRANFHRPQRRPLRRRSRLRRIGALSTMMPGCRDLPLPRRRRRLEGRLRRHASRASPALSPTLQLCRRSRAHLRPSTSARHLPLAPRQRPRPTQASRSSRRGIRAARHSRMARPRSRRKRRSSQPSALENESPRMRHRLRVRGPSLSRAEVPQRPTESASARGAVLPLRARLVRATAMIGPSPVCFARRVPPRRHRRCRRRTRRARHRIGARRMTRRSNHSPQCPAIE